MKNLFTVSIFALSVTLFSCDNKSSEEYNRAPAPGEAPEVTTPITDDGSNPFAPAPANTTPQPATQTQTQTASVEHYICPAGHKGGGGDAAGKCSVCGAELTHNAAFHDQPAQTQTQITNPDQSAQQQPQITPTTEPAQNSKGVYHYICSAGHPGGSGSMENCSVCGAQLVHNDKYHQ